MRSAYDSLVILEKQPDINILTIKQNSQFKSYFQIIALYFNNIPKSSEISFISFKTKLYLFKSKHKYVLKTWNTLIKYYLKITILFNRSIKFLLNKNYRKDVIYDRKRILKRLKH